MKNITLNSWEEFEAEIENLSSENANKKSSTPIHVSSFLYRGHSCSTWKLETTLERYGTMEYPFGSYYRNAHASKYQIESLTNKSWELPSPPEYTSQVRNSDFGTRYASLPGYEYMAYLRHHGFPSPLLDWTRSPHIAAFFAFSNAKSTDNVSIYLYQEYTGEGKSYSAREPYISSAGPYISTHRRHFIQQSEYTVCCVYKDQDYYFSSHEEYFLNNREQQDSLLKFDMPVSERYKVLKKLDAVNINAFSLFGTEDSLMETMALREIYFER